MQQDAALLNRILQHDLDRTDVALTFSARLARENGWPQGYADRVIREYKRFVYLACLSSDELTPSDEVDQAWHLHLAYSRDYWEVFCAQVLGRTLHHGPTAGGFAEAERFENNYLKTLAFYETVFGEKPPPDIWPPPAIRFGAPEKFRRVNLGLFALKPRSSATGRPPFLTIALLLASAVVAIKLSFANDNGSVFAIIFFTGVVTGILYPFCILLYILIHSIFRRLFRRRGEKIQQPQHGFTITYTVGFGAGSASYSVDISGSGDPDSSDSSSDGGDGGCGGCGD